MKRPFKPRICPPASEENDPFIHMVGFETLEEVEERSERLIQVLMRGNRQDKRLADRLSKCRADRPCLSPICPACCREFRRWYADQLISLCSNLTNLWSVTLVPSSRRFEPGQLAEFDMTAFKEAASLQFSRLGYPDLVAVGGVDIDYCVHSDGAFEPHWQPHLHLLTAGIDGNTLKDALKRFYPRSDSVLRPIKVKPAFDITEIATYAVKPFFFSAELLRRQEWQASVRRRPIASAPTAGNRPLHGQAATLRPLVPQERSASRLQSCPNW